MALTTPLARIGRSTLGGLAALGRVTIFAAATLRHIVTPPFYPREFWHAVITVGWLSLPVVGMTAVFTGAALALQIYAGSGRFGAESVVPQIVAIGMPRGENPRSCPSAPCR